VQDMKQLLAAFQKLETDVERDNGEQVEIEADCGSVGKFSTSYSCAVYLSSISDAWTDTLSEKARSYNDTAMLGDCFIISDRSSGIETNEDGFSCSSIVRQSNISRAESIFRAYDISPGQPR
jgi:hypothetical protein